MKQYIFKRILISFVVLFGVSILLYGIARSVPGDYVSNITAGNQNITPEMEQRMRELYGLDKGIVEGYIDWLTDALHGDFGTSFTYQKPVVEIIKDKLNVDAKDITPEASFAGDLGADSLDTVELIMDFEKEFDLQIPDEDAEKISTVGDAIKYVEEHIG